LLRASDHESKVHDVEDPEDPVDEILFDVVLKRDHDNENDIDQSSHDESLSSEPVVAGFSVVVFDLVCAVFLKCENFLLIFEHSVDFVKQFHKNEN